MFEPEAPTTYPGRTRERGRPVRPGKTPAAPNVSATAWAADVITTRMEMCALLDEWRALFDDCGSRNPFADPTWVLTWVEHFVADGNLFVVVLRDGGRLCCVAPFYRRRIGYGSVRLARSLQLIGAIEHVVLTDRPQILVRPEHSRRAIRRVLEVIQRDTGWDWAEVSLAADQGWFEPAWIDGDSAAKCYAVHKTSRPSVGFELPADVDALRSGLKRNLCESMRRARNRLKRADPEWKIEIVDDPAQFADALDGLMKLHGARASMADKIEHADVFAAEIDRTFVCDALMQMARQGKAEALFVEAGGRRVAGLMTLLTPSAVYFSFSGVDPEWWSFSAVTLLQWEAVCRAVASGRTYADLSVGVDVAKMRWTEAIEIHPEFVVVAGRARSEIAFGAYFVVAAAARLLRERARFRRSSRSSQ